MSEILQNLVKGKQHHELRELLGELKAFNNQSSGYSMSHRSLNTLKSATLSFLNKRGYKALKTHESTTSSPHTLLPLAIFGCTALAKPSCAQLAISSCSKIAKCNCTFAAISSCSPPVKFSCNRSVISGCCPVGSHCSQLPLVNIRGLNMRQKRMSYE